jgi:hypothetical protein
MERRQYSREFKLEAVRLAKERGVSYAQDRRRPWGSSDATARLGAAACG